MNRAVLAIGSLALGVVIGVVGAWVVVDQGHSQPGSSDGAASETSNAPPQPCLVALEEAEEFALATAELSRIAAGLAILVPRGMAAGFERDKAALEDINADFEALSARLRDVRISMQEHGPLLDQAKSDCRAIAA